MRQRSALVAVDAQAQGVQLRPGRPADRPTLWRLVLREKLNPLGLDPSRFTVAERAAPGGGSSVVGIGQVKPLSGGAAMELASLVVVEEERGRGVGSALVQSLVSQAGGRPLFLTTISRRMGLYQRCGFEEVPASQVPPFLLFEYVVGIAVAFLAVQDRLVLMRLTGEGAAAAGVQQQQQQQQR